MVHMKHIVSKTLWSVYGLAIAFAAIHDVYTVALNSNVIPVEYVLNVLALVLLVLGIIAYSYNFRLGPPVLWKGTCLVVVPWSLYSTGREMVMLVNLEYWLSWVAIMIPVLFLLPACYAMYRYAFSPEEARARSG
jgi:hypothetical protein